MSENALRLITGVRHQAVVVSGGSSFVTADTHRLPQLVVTVTGFQLYKDANDFYFSHECAPKDGGGQTLLLLFSCHSTSAFNSRP